MADFLSSDQILLAHDGFLNLKCAMLGNFLFKQGLNYAILGAGFNEPARKVAWIYNKVYKRFFDQANYIILRERIAYNFVSRISRNANIKLLPDPAFFCPADRYNKNLVETIQKKYKIDDESTYKIGLTVCEDSISFVKAFLGYPNKVKAHREFIKMLLIYLNQQRNCTFYFLPHCVKEGPGNDLDIARDIKVLLPENVKCYIIYEDMPVLDLKFIISKMDLVIGERTHSIINSISTATPFISLTCSADFRTHDIIGTGCGYTEQIIDLDIPDYNKTIEIIEKTISNEQDFINQLEELCHYHESLKSNFQTIIWN